MAASDLIAAAIAAFFVAHAPTADSVGGALDARCPPWRAGDMISWARTSHGFERAPVTSRLALGGFGCASPDSTAARALAIVRGWLNEAPGEPRATAVPRPKVAIAELPDPADADPIQKIVRNVIAELHARDPKVRLDRKQLVCLQRALYFEARGEQPRGQAAVAHVALNRVGTRPNRSSVCAVVREPGQFAPYLTGEPDEAELAQTDEEATRAAVETAARVMAGYIPDPSRGGQYFYAPAVLKTQPVWVKALKETARIGGHRFFADPEDRETRIARN